MSTSHRRPGRRRAKKEEGRRVVSLPSDSQLANARLHLGRHGHRGSCLPAPSAFDLPLGFHLGATHLPANLAAHLATYLANDAFCAFGFAPYLAFGFALGFGLGPSFRCHFITSVQRGEGRLASPFPVQIRGHIGPRSELPYFLPLRLALRLALPLALPLALDFLLAAIVVPSFAAEEVSLLRLIQV